MAWAFILLVAAVLAESVMDPMFSLNPGVRGHVDSSSLRPEGKILPGGKFRLVDELRYAVVQLDADGRLDPEFQPLRTDMILDEWQPVDLALPSDGYALLTIGGSTQRISPDGRDVRAWGAFGSAPVCGGENSVPGQLFVGSDSANGASGSSPRQDHFFIGAAARWRSANPSFDRI